MREHDTEDFYHSKRWKSIRAIVMKRDGYQCQLAKRQGKAVDADLVHHIFPREEYPEYQFETWNLIALSKAAHNMVHERETHKLSEIGEELRKETAKRMGIEGIKQTILVVGRPGSGKTDYVRRRLRGGVVYDLDAIAGALRMKRPKEEHHMPSRMLANSMARGFAKAAHNYVDTVYIIRTAPDQDEIFDIDPDFIVYMTGAGDTADLSEDRRHTIAQRLKELTLYAERNGIPLEERELP